MLDPGNTKLLLLFSRHTMQNLYAKVIEVIPDEAETKGAWRRGNHSKTRRCRVCGSLMIKLKSKFLSFLVKGSKGKLKKSPLLTTSMIFQDL